MDIVLYYGEFRTALFLSSLTLGTFLFTMKAFIVQTIKKEIYDHERHKSFVENYAKEYDIKPEYYKGIKDLSRLIFWAISFSFFSSLVQLTVGYFGVALAVLFCIAVSAVSWLLFGRVLYIVSENMQDMLEYAEDDAQDELIH